MKIYIAARFRKRDFVEKLATKLEEIGHKTMSKWTKDPSIQPYEENKKLAEKYALRDIDSIKDSDIFVLISDRSGTGMYTELGEAIFSNRFFGKPTIYVVGKYTSGSIQFFLPFVKRLNTIEDLFKIIGPK